MSAVTSFDDISTIYSWYIYIYIYMAVSQNIKPRSIPWTHRTIHTPDPYQNAGDPDRSIRLDHRGPIHTRILTQPHIYIYIYHRFINQLIYLPYIADISTSYWTIIIFPAFPRRIRPTSLRQDTWPSRRENCLLRSRCMMAVLARVALQTPCCRVVKETPRERRWKTKENSGSIWLRGEGHRC